MTKGMYAYTLICIFILYTRQLDVKWCFRTQSAHGKPRWKIKFIKTNKSPSPFPISWSQYKMFAVGCWAFSQVFTLIIKHIMPTVGY